MNIEFLQLLLLIIIANGAPIVLSALLHHRFNTAVDFGHLLADGRPLFGPSKTWRGIFAAIMLTPCMAWLLGYPTITGLLAAIYAVLGDLTSSFIKRRLGKQPSSMAPLLDQIPEALFPALMLMDRFSLAIPAVLLLVLSFVIIELVLSHILYKLGIRKQPY